MIRTLMPLLALSLLAACGNDPVDGGNKGDQRAAEGDVLKGSISDEMLPVDSLQSVSPPMKVAPSPVTSASSAATATDQAAIPDDAATPAAPDDTGQSAE